MPGVVCSAIAVHTVSTSRSAMPWLRRKSRASVGAVHLEAVVRAGMRGGEAHVVKHRAGVKQLGVEAQAAALAAQRAPVIDAARMIEQQRRFGVPDQLGDLPRQRAVGNGHTGDRWFTHC